VRSFTKEDGSLFVGFPLHDKSDNLQTYHYRGVANGTLTREFWYQRGSKLTVPVFGWHLVNKSKASRVVVCEGETDTLALATALRHRKDTVVVGAVGSGFARKLAAWLTARLDKQEVVLALDNDKAGREASTEVVAALKNSRPTTVIKRLAFDAQDVGDALKAGEALEEALDSAPLATVSTFLGAAAIAQDVLEFIATVGSTRAIRLNFSPSLDAAVRIQPGKLIGIIGTGGCGKSTLAEHILLETLNSSGARAMMLSAEMKAYEVALKLVSTHDGFGYFDLDWLTGASEKQRADLNASVLATCKRFSISDEFGGMTLPDLEQAIHEQIAVGNAPDLVVVDHFLAVASELENTKLEELAKGFKAMARNCNTCVVVICHTRKPANVGGKRTIHRPTMADEYGSGGLGKYCDCVLGVAIDRGAQTLLVETVKVERMGGKHADIRLKLTNWQLHEDDKSEGLRDYTEDDDETY
jgi:5S rRNA maturation endonuclease (ribonuclease M5)